MKIELERRWKRKGYTIGVLSVNGQRICEAVEDEDRGLSSDMPLKELQAKKIKGQTAIPTGTYKVVITYSPRFKKQLPLLQDVPGYEGVRIHPGNTAKDTEGCILCGRNTIKGGVTDSRLWTGKVIDMIDEALKNKEEVTIWIR
jgi:hypothetical protein